ncbi:hypothetical protein B4N89_20745 [Embleya scabrispora]|uniref:Uncharacterized protein n=1 Tax=Embleya scabrispora TaxID=159449 RepID=A0A1T3P1R5_9ACTN|nr:hypothetical protein [Embleya scabrispora]OPC83043.1 hypothetical protein B4N89_20745 [Embleya scabrispora]
MTEPLANHLADAATAAGLVLPHAVDCSDGHASVHTRPASMGQWQQWCDLVAVDAQTITTKNESFTYGKGGFGDYRITLYGHGVPGLRLAATTGRPTDPATRST